jgi:ribosomal protein S18 acetylase RimI-like enzyme
MDLDLVPASTEVAPELAVLHSEVAETLTTQFGRGPWSTKTSVKGVLYAMRTSRVFIARDGAEIVATLRLTTKKPWAIDASCFKSSSKLVYLLAMAVRPNRQRQRIGSRCLVEAERIAREMKADAIRLDTYDANAGASGFYSACGYEEIARRSYRGTALIYFELRL